MAKPQLVTDEQYNLEPPLAQPSEHAPSMREVMRNRDFLKLWIAQILSQTAQQIINYALVQLVFQITQSSTAVGGVIISFTIPAILFAAIAGVFVERNSKRKMLVITNIARGVMVLAYIFTGRGLGAGASLPIIYTVTLLFSGVSQFFSPAEASKIPLVVRREELVAANSLFNLTLTGTALGGFVLLGPVLVGTIFRDNYVALYILICILCLAAAALTYFLPHDEPVETMAELLHRGENNGDGAREPGKIKQFMLGMAAAWQELREGWAFIRRDSAVGNAIIYWSIAIAVFMMLGTIGPGFLYKEWNIAPEHLFYILLPGGVGLVLGVLVVGRFSNPGNRETMINKSLLAAGGTLFIFAAVKPIVDFINNTVHVYPPEWLILFILGGLTLFLGAFNSFISVLAQTALQERSPEEIRARVFSAFYTISNAILLFPVFFAGAMADSLGYLLTVALIGLVVFLIAAYGLYRAIHRKVITSPLGTGEVTHQEAEAALMVGSPAPRPIPADTQQKLSMLGKHKHQKRS